MAELNITNIPAPRVPFVDERTGLMAREWYRFFLNLFVLTGSGNNPITLEELQLGPPNQPNLAELLIQINQNIAPQYEDQSGDFLATLDTAQLMSMMSRFENAEAAIQGAYLQPVVQTGTIANYNLDNSPTAGGIAYGTGPALAVSAAGTLGQVLTSAGAGTPTWSSAAAGTVTSVSVVSANGLAGTVATATTTPAITLSTTVTGLLKGNGTAISAAASGTDYAPATSGTSILYGDGAGGFNNVTIGTGVAFAGGTLSATGSGGTVTSVAALTLGTTGTDLSSTVANGTTTPVITLQVPTASASNRGALSAADWTTFNNKGSGTVTSVTGTSPVVSSGGATPAISMAAATTSVNGYLTSTDWNTFNGKQPAGSYLVNGGALGTPSSGTVTNLTGTASININGTVGATTANTGAFTTLSATQTISATGGSVSSVVDPAVAINYQRVLRFNDSSNTSWAGYILSSGTLLGIGGNTSIAFDVGGATYATLTSSGLAVTGTGSFTGNVGIGTASPSSSLHIAQSAAAATGPILFLHNTAATQAGAVGNLSQITFGLDTGASAAGGNAYILAQEDGSSSYGASIQFGVSNGSSNAAEVLRILSNGNLKLQKNMSVGGATVTTSGAGITFPATQSASTDANTLDDYEEGTWTPVLTPSTSGTITITSPTNSMVYTKVGRVVTISGNITIASVSAPIGDLRLTGLPFSAGSLTSGGIFIYGLGITSTVTAYQIAIDTVLPTTVLIRGFFNGDQVSTVANNAQASGGFILTVQYTV